MFLTEEDLLEKVLNDPNRHFSSPLFNPKLVQTWDPGENIRWPKSLSSLGNVYFVAEWTGIRLNLSGLLRVDF